MSKPRKARRGLYASMDRPLRRSVIVLSAASLVLVVICAILLYRVGTSPATAKGSIMATAQAFSADAAPEATTQAASSAHASLAASAVSLLQHLPVHAVLGFGLGFAVVFFARRIHRINASIDAMSRRPRS